MWYNKFEVFHFTTIDNIQVVRIFPLEDYKKISINKDSYKFGVIYIRDEEKTKLVDEDEVFKSIPSEIDFNTVVSDKDIIINTKPVPYYETIEVNN